MNEQPQVFPAKQSDQEHVHKTHQQESPASTQEIIDSFVIDFNQGNVKELNTVGDRNLGIFEYGGKIIKLLKPKRSPESESLDRLRRRVGDLPQVFVPQQSFRINDSLYGVIMEKAPGTSAENLTSEQINLIPQEHWDELEKTIRALSRRGIQTDLTKRSNFLYDTTLGFSFIDLETTGTEEGIETGKFFFRNGQEFYYPFERYRVMPVPYTTSRALFTHIEK